MAKVIKREQLREMSTLLAATQGLSSNDSGYQNSRNSYGAQYGKADFQKSLHSLTYKHKGIFFFLIVTVLGN